MTRFDSAPLSDGNSPRHRRQIAQVLNRAMQGKLNATGDVTLTTTAEIDIDLDDPRTTTVVDDPLCGPESFISFMPTTRTAAEESASGNLYVSERLNGQFTITHTAAAISDRVFRYLIIG